MFDEEPDAPIHGECEMEIKRLQNQVSFLEGESAKDLKCLRFQEARIAALEEMLKSYD